MLVDLDDDRRIGGGISDGGLDALERIDHPVRLGLLLDDPEVVTEVVDGDRGLLAFAAYDAESLRHLAVHPDAARERDGDG